MAGDMTWWVTQHGVRLDMAGDMTWQVMQHCRTWQRHDIACDITGDTQ